MKFGIGKIIVFAVFSCVFNLRPMEQEGLSSFNVKGLGKAKVKELVVLDNKGTNEKVYYFLFSTLNDKGEPILNDKGQSINKLGYLFAAPEQDKGEITIVKPDNAEHITSALYERAFNIFATQNNGELFVGGDPQNVKLHNHPIKALYGNEEALISGSSFPSIKATYFEGHKWQMNTIIKDGYLLAANKNMVIYGVPEPAWYEKFYFAIGRYFGYRPKSPLAAEMKTYVHLYDKDTRTSKEETFNISKTAGKENVYTFTKKEIDDYILPPAAAHTNIAVLFNRNAELGVTKQRYKLGTTIDYGLAFMITTIDNETKDTFYIRLPTDIKEGPTTRITYEPTKIYIVNNKFDTQAKYRNADLLCIRPTEVYVIKSIQNQRDKNVQSIPIFKPQLDESIVASTLVEDSDNFTLYLMLQEESRLRSGKYVPTGNNRLVIINKNYVEHAQ